MVKCILFIGTLDVLSRPEARAMMPLETLYRLEIEFHRRLRTLAPGTADTGGLHTSYALQAGYEQYIAAIGPVTARDVESLRERLTMGGDTRDILAARDSLKQLLGLSPHGPSR
jgi:hypothetical protein